MEGGEEQQPHPGEGQHIPPVNQDPAFIGTMLSSFIGFFEQYGWFLLLGVVVLLYLKSKFASSIEQWRSQREASSYKKMDGGKAQERLESMEKARLRMQEQLDMQAKEFAEKQRRREEEKRQERLEDWDRHQEGKGYRSKTKATPAGSSTSSPASGGSSSGTKSLSQQPKKRMRPDYNPLMGDTGDVCRFRSSPRGGASGGG